MRLSQYSEPPIRHEMCQLQQGVRDGRCALHVVFTQPTGWARQKWREVAAQLKRRRTGQFMGACFLPSTFCFEFELICAIHAIAIPCRYTRACAATFRNKTRISSRRAVSFWVSISHCEEVFSRVHGNLLKHIIMETSQNLRNCRP